MIIKIIRKILGEIVIIIDLITRPKPIQRTEQEQNRMIQLAKTVSLCQFHGCPFCVKVRRALHRLNVTIALRDVQNNELFRKELEEKGGKIKVPCLRIETKSGIEWLYESKDIIKFLENLFKPKQT